MALNLSGYEENLNIEIRKKRINKIVKIKF